MIQIDDWQIRQWEVVNRLPRPSAVSAICPKCSLPAIFHLIDPVFDGPRSTFSASSKCPACVTKVHFWTIYPANAKLAEKTDSSQSQTFMHPHPLGYHETQDFKGQCPESILKSYSAAVDSYNTKNYTATGVCCRRTLEGVFKLRLPEPQRTLTLHNAIQSVAETANFAKPLLNLAHAIRNGGNLASHFDLDKEPDQEMAKSMVQLLEYLIEYIYVLPSEIERLDEKLNDGS